MVSNKLLTERARPKKLEHIILTQRVAKEIGEGKLDQNYLFAGNAGIGKTTLAKILSAGRDTLYINASMDRGIETIKKDVVEFCSTRSFGDYIDEIKVVILDEIDGAADMFFKSLRGVMNDYPFIRFIATCNYLNKISDPIQSRFSVIEFDPKDKTEEEELFKKYAKRVLQITKKLGIEWESKEVLMEFIKKNFPDLRKIVSKIQSFYSSEIKTITLDDIKKMHFIFSDLYNKIISTPDTEANYKFIMTEYANKSEEVLSSLGTEFIEWIRDNHPHLNKKIAQILIYVTDYQAKRRQVIDPMLAVLSCIFEIQMYIHKP